MKIVLLFAIAAVATAAKLPTGSDHNPETALIGVVRDDRDGPIEANYKYVLETENGIRLQESGAPGSAGQSNKDGSFSYISPEGITVEIAYTADEGGFQPRGEFVPVDHPLPPMPLNNTESLMNREPKESNLTTKVSDSTKFELFSKARGNGTCTLTLPI